MYTYIHIYIYTYLSAFGKRPCARITRRSHHGINPILSLYQMSLQVGTNIHPNRPQIQPVGTPKSMNLGFKIGLGGLLEGSWRGLGGSWVGLGDILGPRWFQEPYMFEFVNKSYASWEPSWGPKSLKIVFKSDPKGKHFCDHFLDRLLKPFGAILAPTWFPKPLQNGAKLAPKSMQVGVLICCLLYTSPSPRDP